MKKVKLFLGVFLLSVALVGCSSSKLSEDFDEAKVKSSAQEIVDLTCSGEYDKIIDKMNDEMKAAITAEQLKEGWNPMLTKLGKFESISKEAVVGKEIDGEDVATVVEIVKFENGKAQFTITYDKDMKLSGLYMK